MILSPDLAEWICYIAAALVLMVAILVYMVRNRS